MTVQGKVALRLNDVSKHFGGISAANKVNLSLPYGAVTGLVGPNGAGKTTMFNLITGHLRPDEGSINLDGASILGLSPRAISLRGIARSFQALRLFSHMTVLENILTVTEYSPWSFLSSAAEQRARLERSEEILEQVGLAHRRNELAVDISYAEQKFLSLGRILAMKANVWLLDEPASGLDLNSYERFFAILRKQVDAGVAICLIEHNLDIVRGISDRIAFLERGTVLDQGEPERILGDERLIAIYFGETV
ncbi:ABC transporter ATP-binding protein [Brucella anthropi]|jgi:branched-chain amino acid transport system ATP-binding protein|uniref:ABC transporter ATP-binding protein n=1 Tax=Brucella anthropi TaxID=529 RepID=UPI001746B506|nr:ABC transporter ATP-binding protein [Brucella anthropi]QOD67107.1 ABC transporter ATP-binding protein [Ochrobactrum sp. MT180101]